MAKQAMSLSSDIEKMERMINEIKQNEKKRMKGQTNIMITIDNNEYLEELIN